MNKFFINPKWIYIILLSFIGCNTKNTDSTKHLSKINIAKWNQLTINHLIDSFRIDTTSFTQIKQPPPLSKILPYSYPTDATIFNNDIATSWNFINKRSCFINIVDSLYETSSSNFQIIEFYKFYNPTVYEISDSKTSYKIILNRDSTKLVSKIDSLSLVISGYIDNRELPVTPIRTLIIKSKTYNNLNKGNDFIIETLYIDSSLYYHPSL